MSETPEGLVEDEGDIERLGEATKRATIPGRENAPLVNTADDLPDVLEAFVADTNNWFEVLDVRVYRNDNIGIPARWRWTIKRWVVNDMDQWLVDNGWSNIPHLKADSREHEERELEARYRKEFHGYQVWANFYVEFTDDVFEAMKKGRPIEGARQNRERREKIGEVREMKRGEP